MPALSLKEELKKGLRKTAPHILSHHSVSEYYKCYTLEFKHKVRICARCIGIYSGILLGVIILITNAIPERIQKFAIIVFPFFALLDWSFTEFTTHKGRNTIRTISGLILGVAYTFALFLFITKFPNYLVITTGAAYGAIATLLLFIKNRQYQKSKF